MLLFWAGSLERFSFTPLVIGFVMLLVGSWRAKHGLSVLRIERFAYGYLFALGLALIRFFFAK